MNGVSCNLGAAEYVTPLIHGRYEAEKFSLVAGVLFLRVAHDLVVISITFAAQFQYVLDSVTGCVSIEAVGLSGVRNLQARVVNKTPLELT